MSAIIALMVIAVISVWMVYVLAFGGGPPSGNPHDSGSGGAL